MKKQRLSRKSLDELAKIMPVLSEDEQRNCIGGTRYYDSSGILIADIGPNNDMRVVGEQFREESGNFSEESLASNSVPLSSCSDEIKYNVLNTVANNLGTSSGVSLFHDSNPGHWGGYSKETGIVINANARLFEEGNYYDFYLAIKHEDHHSGTADEKNTNKREYEAYKTVLEDPNFQNTSARFQAVIREQYRYYKQFVEP